MLFGTQASSRSTHHHYLMPWLPGQEPSVFYISVYIALERKEKIAELVSSWYRLPPFSLVIGFYQTTSSKELRSQRIKKPHTKACLITRRLGGVQTRSQGGHKQLVLHLGRGISRQKGCDQTCPQGVVSSGWLVHNAKKGATRTMRKLITMDKTQRQ